ncbi:MAG: LemA family protein [Solirubrobacterales bacterium]|nr:LemA family protein [Solirubrobacterales bacterium]
MTAVYALLAVLALAAVWAVLAYNALVAARNRCDEAWSGVDVQLKRRHDLVPNLVETVRGYAEHEQATLARVTDARARAMSATTPFERAKAERELGASLGLVTALAEQYPALRAVEAFSRLQAQLAELEDEIQAGRRIYNADVRHFLTRKQSFPAMLVVPLGDFPDRPYFELDSTRERQVPQVAFAA